MNKTKRRIFTTAIKLFAEKGFDNAGIEEITAVAGVAKGSLYYHFETKEELFNLLIEEGLKLLKNSIEIKFRKCDNPLDKLKAIIMVQIKSIIRYTDFVTVVMNNSIGEMPRSKKCREALEDYILFIKDVIDEGIKEKTFNVEDSLGVAYGVLGIIYSSLLYNDKNKKNVTPEQIYDSYAKIIIDGITKV